MADYLQRKLLNILLAGDPIRIVPRRRRNRGKPTDLRGEYKNSQPPLTKRRQLLKNDLAGIGCPIHSFERAHIDQEIVTPYHSRRQHVRDEDAALLQQAPQG